MNVCNSNSESLCVQRTPVTIICWTNCIRITGHPMVTCVCNWMKKMIRGSCLGISNNSVTVNSNHYPIGSTNESSQYPGHTAVVRSTSSLLADLDKKHRSYIPDSFWCWEKSGKEGGPLTSSSTVWRESEMPWSELPWALFRMTNGMASWDVTDIEAYINETVPTSWAPLDSYLVLYGTENFKWT